MIEAFFNEPFLAQFFIGFVLLFFFFVFVIELKLFCIRLAKKGGYWIEVAKFVCYPFLVFFLVCDAVFNIVYMPLLFGFEMADKHGEGWLVTDRVKYHIDVGEFEIGEGIKPDWRYKVALFICRNFLNSVDPGHCA